MEHKRNRKPTSSKAANENVGKDSFPTTPFESSKLDIGNSKFNPNARELRLSWFSCAESVYCINTYPNGITLSIHNIASDNEEEEVLSIEPDQFHLRVKDTKDYRLPTGKYFLYKQNYIGALEQHLSALHKADKLRGTVFYLGTIADPFLSLHRKFNVTMAVLELLQQYRPGLVVVQTRSPMVIAGLPMLKGFDERVVVAMPIESNSERIIQRYTPGLPKLAERLVAADGLRKQGLRVNLLASPILPYGEYHRNAWDFAELLDRHADYISLGCLAAGTKASGGKIDETQLKSLPIARRLVADDQLRLLRPHAYRYLYYALSVIAPEKLLLPIKVDNKPNQLSLFAA